MDDELVSDFGGIEFKSFSSKPTNNLCKCSNCIRLDPRRAKYLEEERRELGKNANLAPRGARAAKAALPTESEPAVTSPA